MKELLSLWLLFYFIILTVVGLVVQYGALETAKHVITGFWLLALIVLTYLVISDPD